MSTLMLVNAGLAVVALVLAVVLALVYVRNHREIRSPFTFGLLLFACFLVLQDGMTVSHMGAMMVETPEPVNELFVLGENVLQLAASATLVAATLR